MDKTIAGQTVKIPKAPWWSKLQAIGACIDAVNWCKTQPNIKTAWSVCERGDWMLWLLGRLSNSAPWSDERKPMVRAACAVAREAIKDARCDAARICIETTEAWCDGKATKEQVIAARRNAAAAAYAAADAAAAYAAAAYAADSAAAADSAYAADSADSAAYAAAAADAAADSAAAAAYDAAAYAAADAAAYAARRASLKRSADIAREHFPKAPSLVVKRK